MTTKDFTANVISASKVVPDSNLQTGKASGVWDLNEVLDLVKGGNWPTFGNVITNSDDVFNTQLYTGNNSTDTQTFNTGLDMSGEGGLIWFKSRSSTQVGRLIDTVRGTNQSLIPSSTNASGGLGADGLTFLSNGFSIGWTGGDLAAANDYAAWSFRKAPKFFDVVTWTGDGTTFRDIAHNLGSVPGHIIVKKTSGGSATGWVNWHRTFSDYDALFLDGSSAKYNDGSNNSLFGQASNMTSTHFELGGNGNISYINENSSTYVAYVFAHNNSDGEFGPNKDQDIIKCGSYTGDGGAGTTEVDLGFEPQWILVKASSAADNWYIIDNMRGWGTHNNQANDAYLYANATNSEATGGVLDITSTGFKTTLYTNANVNGRTYIYMAIRRGSMQTPTAASDVFAIDTVQSSSGTGPAFISGFVTDFLFSRQITATQDWLTNARLLGQNEVKLNSTAAQSTNSAYNWDYMNGAWDAFSANPVFSAWMWKRARGYFDVVATKAVSSNNGDINHNLGVKPEMAWYKRRDGTDEWYVATAIDGYLVLDKNNAANGTASGSWLDAVGGSIGGNDATATTINSGYKFVGNASYDMLILLFASLAGISKVGSFTQSGATNVACGFSGDTPSLVILKRTDSTGDWYLFDYANGIVSGNDPYNLLNSDAAQVTNADIVDPYSGGFATTSSLTDGDYIFYAIAAVS